MRRLWYFLPLTVVFVVILLGVHSYLSLHAPLNKGVLVVEGWLDNEALEEVAELFSHKDYDNIVTTGTTTSFTYYLNKEQRLELTGSLLSELANFHLTASGLAGARMTFFSGVDTLFDSSLNEQTTTYSFEAKNTLGDTLTIKTYSTVPTNWNHRISIVNSLTINGRNAHDCFTKVVHFDRLNNGTKGNRTYADQAKQTLALLGVDTSLIKALPYVDCSALKLGRTNCNAYAFSMASKTHNWQYADLVSQGVHSRRSFKSYAARISDDLELGVISLPDSSCMENWLFSDVGRSKVSKELLALFFGKSIEKIRHE